MSSRKVGNMHHAPWSHKFKTVCCRGSMALELQIGPIVIQRFYEPQMMLNGHRWHIWKDRCWR